jgi:glycosyltransferase involved in cell wall biosynthesis
MKLSGLPILSVMKQNSIPLIYSSWGSDMFNFEHMHVTKKEVNSFLNRTNYLVTDCKRDHEIALKNGFNGDFLGVYPGNGGIDINNSVILPYNKRNVILIKGYDDGVGKASKVLEALSMVTQKSLKGKKIVIYSADDSLANQIKDSKILSSLPIKIHSRYAFILNKTLMDIMSKSCIHIANSLSDGMPNSLLEAMAMGAFPIQSNPGRVTEEVIIDNKNGLLITEPLNANQIANLIEKALKDEKLRKEAQKYNHELMQIHYNRTTLQPIIVNLYKNVKDRS